MCRSMSRDAQRAESRIYLRVLKRYMPIRNPILSQFNLLDVLVVTPQIINSTAEQPEIASLRKEKGLRLHCLSARVVPRLAVWRVRPPSPRTYPRVPLGGGPLVLAGTKQTASRYGRTEAQSYQSYGSSGGGSAQRKPGRFERSLRRVCSLRCNHSKNLVWNMMSDDDGREQVSQRAEKPVAIAGPTRCTQTYANDRYFASYASYDNALAEVTCMQCIHGGSWGKRGGVRLGP
ncbi:hypothetical protein EJ05DRAFT_526493 [Pseudovirgaria hyperparasitica]|uniref:Uncharacterized protein n=1 Tax=Pseudovirgaria hyperparasitica TaxID=470096 RepID=A0A6A6WC95_9PEZI|nr:uncharacterized protein EJ05DRAFT_526493 [Pseudovirgaria hyperparasitica]KAF2759799.1 hypothetical protein EJ05DRAFT_526493 [Pseudovirgaria hyperparasitica]